MVLDHFVIDWRSVRDLSGGSGVTIGRLLDRIERRPAADAWDEHYHLGCPHCAARLAIVIGDHGHYSAIRDDNDGDIHRVPLRSVNPQDLTGIGRWMHDTASASGVTTLADGLTYLFG